jgi:hypothetical protein
MPEKEKLALDSDLASEAFKALQDHPTKHSLVAGKPEQSELYLRVSTKRYQLTYAQAFQQTASINRQELAIIKKWITQGAVTNRIGHL